MTSEERGDEAFNRTFDKWLNRAIFFVGTGCALLVGHINGERNALNNSWLASTARAKFDKYTDLVEDRRNSNSMNLSVLSLYQNGYKPIFEEVAKALGTDLPAKYDENHIVGYFRIGRGSQLVPITPANMEMLNQHAAYFLNAQETKGLQEQAGKGGR